MGSSLGTPTKHQLIYESVRKRIEHGTFRPGDRLPSDSTLVEEFGVSRPTVAKALQLLERRGFVERKPGSGTYVLEIGGEGMHFGLLIPGMGETEIFDPICGEMARIAKEKEHGLLWGASTAARFGGDQDKEATALDLCRQYVKERADGVFFAPLELTPNCDRVNRKIIDELGKADIPVVLLDRDYLPYPERSLHDLVGVDNRRVGYLITHHLFEQGCNKVLFVTRPNSASTIDARIAGFVEAVVKDDGSFEASLVHRCDPRDEAHLSKILKTEKPDGIVCGNDVTAGILMHSLHNLDIQVPDDIMVAGIDDVKYAELLRVPLSTIRQPCEAIGFTAFEAMLDRVSNPDAPVRDILVGCELVVRQSTVAESNASSRGAAK